MGWGEKRWDRGTVIGKGVYLPDLPYLKFLTSIMETLSMTCRPFEAISTILLTIAVHNARVYTVGRAARWIDTV